MKGQQCCIKFSKTMYMLALAISVCLLAWSLVCTKQSTAKHGTARQGTTQHGTARRCAAPLSYLS